jgi:hypothetical protein
MVVRVRVCVHNSFGRAIYYTTLNSKKSLIHCHIARVRLNFYQHGGQGSLAKHEVLSVVLPSDMLRSASGQISQKFQVNVVPTKRRILPN